MNAQEYQNILYLNTQEIVQYQACRYSCILSFVFYKRLLGAETFKKCLSKMFSFGHQNTAKLSEQWMDQLNKLTGSRISLVSELTSSHSLKHKNLASSGHYMALSKPSWPQKSLTRLSKA